MQSVIMDIVVVCVLVGFACYGAYRGLFRSLAGLLAVLVALVGAGLFAKTLTPAVVNVLSPVIASKVEQRVDDAISTQTDWQEMPELDGGSASDARLEELLGLLGLDSAARENIVQQTREKLQEAGATLFTAVVESLMTSILYGVLFVLSFFVLLVAIHLLCRALDLVLKLPGLHGLNTLGGAGFGLLEGGLLLFLAIWAARHFGVSFETELVADTHILRFFTANTPLSVLSFLL